MSHLVLVQLLAYKCRCRTVPRSHCTLGCDAKLQVRHLPRKNLGIFLEVRFNARDATSLHVSIK
jgi:hypothetical protein